MLLLYFLYFFVYFLYIICRHDWYEYDSRTLTANKVTLSRKKREKEKKERRNLADSGTIFSSENSTSAGNRTRELAT